MATGDMNLDEARDFFRQAGVNVGGKNIVSVAIAHNGPVATIVALDVNDDIWVFDNTKDKDHWVKLPAVPFMTRIVSEPENLST